jgi:chromosome segregation ATPase
MENVMEEELKALLEKARNHKMTPGELFEQRVSFVYSACGEGESKESVRALLAETYGDPAAYEAEITSLRAEIASRDAALVKAREELTECVTSLDRLQSNSEKLLVEARRARADALEEAAVAGYIACAETRHVRLGDRVATAIRALATQGDGA